MSYHDTETEELDRLILAVAERIKNSQAAAQDALAYRMQMARVEQAYCLLIERGLLNSPLSERAEPYMRMLHKAVHEYRSMIFDRELDDAEIEVRGGHEEQPNGTIHYEEGEGHD